MCAESEKKYEIQAVLTEPTRLDAFLAQHFVDSQDSGFTRSQLKNLIQAGKVQVNSQLITKAGYELKTGDRIVLKLQADDKKFDSYTYDLSIIYQDSDLVVIDKPPNLTMHPGAGNKNKTLLNAVLPLFKDEITNFPSGTRPGIVHRLDKDTSGLVVVALTSKAHVSLAEQFANRTISRAYKALVSVTPRARRAVQREESGKIDTFLVRDSNNRKKYIVSKDTGKQAITNWKRLDQYPYACLLELRLETGRTHQIRVHLQHLASPIIGDRIYGSNELLPHSLKQASISFGRQALHAYKLGFDHPTTGKRMEFESEVPKDMQDLIDKFKSYED